MDSTTSKTNLWLIRAFALSAASWYQGNHHFIIAMIWLPVKSQVPGQQTQCALKYKKTSALAIDFPVLANAADTDFACLSPAPVALGPEVQLTVSCFFLFQKQCKRSHIYLLSMLICVTMAVNFLNFQLCQFLLQASSLLVQMLLDWLFKKNSGQLTWYLSNLLHKRISDNMKIWGNLTVLVKFALSLLSNAISTKSNCCNKNMFEIILKNFHHKKFYTSPACGAYDNYHVCHRAQPCVMFPRSVQRLSFGFRTIGE